MEFEVEASLLVNEGGLQCVPVVFARPRGSAPVSVGRQARLNGMRVVSLDPARAAQRGAGLVAFILDDPMDARWFHPGDVVSLTND
ncbi:MAG TPA: hypothetical protein VE620_14505 [Myxococcales bacterium]|nr:hypothetical protein [Myxococcales bacterium]